MDNKTAVALCEIITEELEKTRDPQLIMDMVDRSHVRYIVEYLLGGNRVTTFLDEKFNIGDWIDHKRAMRVVNMVQLLAESDIDVTRLANIDAVLAKFPAMVEELQPAI